MASSELLAEYRKLAKRADQRLIRIEALSHEKHFQNVKKWAYAGAQRSIRAIHGDDTAKRFNRKFDPNATDYEVRRAINAVQDFLHKVTSTKTNIVRTFVKRCETINDNYGTDFTWEDIAGIFESGLWDKMNEQYGSHTVWRQLGKFKNQDRLQDVIDTFTRTGNIVVKTMSDTEFMEMEDGLDLPFD